MKWRGVRIFIVGLSLLLLCATAALWVGSMFSVISRGTSGGDVTYTVTVWHGRMLITRAVVEPGAREATLQRFFYGRVAGSPGPPPASFHLSPLGSGQTPWLGFEYGKFKTGVEEPVESPRFGSGVWALPASADFVIIPLWSLTLLWSIPLGWWGWSAYRRRPKPQGLCPNCGYDLRATPERCPECGLAIGIGDFKS
jgi:hypothetical protein